MDPEHTGRLPAGLVLIRTTDVFDTTTAPVGLRRAHRVADGVWGRLVVRTGTLRFVFEDEPDRVRVVASGQAVVIPPGRFHHVVLDEPVTFAIEFHREPDRASPTTGGESGGPAAT